MLREVRAHANVNLIKDLGRNERLHGRWRHGDHFGHETSPLASVGLRYGCPIPSDRQKRALALRSSEAVMDLSEPHRVNSGWSGTSGEGVLPILRLDIKQTLGHQQHRGIGELSGFVMCNIVG